MSSPSDTAAAVQELFGILTIPPFVGFNGLDKVAERFRHVNVVSNYVDLRASQGVKIEGWKKKTTSFSTVKAVINRNFSRGGSEPFDINNSNQWQNPDSVWIGELRFQTSSRMAKTIGQTTASATDLEALQMMTRDHTIQYLLTTTIPNAVPKYDSPTRFPAGGNPLKNTLGAYGFGSLPQSAPNPPPRGNRNSPTLDS